MTERRALVSRLARIILTNLGYKVNLEQRFPNFSGVRTTKSNLVVREAQNIDLYRDSLTASVVIQKQS
jgi:hypothetical protein